MVGSMRDAQRAGQRVAMRARERHHLIARLKNAPRARHDLLSRRGERDALGLPLDELHSEVLLELL